MNPMTILAIPLVDPLLSDSPIDPPNPQPTFLNQCYRVLHALDTLCASLNNILHQTYNSLASDIFAKDLPLTHSYIFHLCLSARRS